MFSSRTSIDGSCLLIQHPLFLLPKNLTLLIIYVNSALATKKVPSFHYQNCITPIVMTFLIFCAGDFRDVNLRITRDIRERKEPIPKLTEKLRDREIHREVVDHIRPDRDRSKINEDRFKDRDNKRLHDRLETDRNARNVRNENRDLLEDKGRRNERPPDSGRAAVNRHPNESVFDRMRNRYNDRRNAENQKLGRDRLTDVRKDRPAEKEPVKSRNVDANGGPAVDRLVRDRRPHVVVASARSRSLHRDRKDPDRSAIERRSPGNFDRKVSSPATSRKCRYL